MHADILIAQILSRPALRPLLSSLDANFITGGAERLAGHRFRRPRLLSTLFFRRTLIRLLVFVGRYGLPERLLLEPFLVH